MSEDYPVMPHIYNIERELRISLAEIAEYCEALLESTTDENTKRQLTFVRDKAVKGLKTSRI